jgi:hypothetical protein
VGQSASANVPRAAHASGFGLLLLLYFAEADCPTLALHGDAQRQQRQREDSRERPEPVELPGPELPAWTHTENEAGGYVTPYGVEDVVKEDVHRFKVLRA